MKITEKLILIIILLSFILGIYFYPQMPERMASHWDVQGQVDGYVSKIWGLFLMPFIFIFLALIFFAIPKIDPLKTNIEKFRKYYDRFVILFFFFLFSIYFYIILWNLGIKINLNLFLPFGFAILFFYIGILFENSKRNWFIGIRTPWTLNNEKIWNKTHKIGGKLFKIAGIIALFGIFFQKYMLFFIVFPMLIIVFYTFIYSYLEYKKQLK